MGLFDFLKKKKEPDYDPTNIGVKDLKKGFVFDYDLKTWQVLEEYEYDWGDSYFTQEYKIEAGNDDAYLHVDPNEDMFITLTRKVRIRSIREDIPEKIVEKQRPPKKLEYEGRTFYLEGQNPGYFNNQPDNENTWTELISWDYYDDKGEFTIAIEQWGERDFEASYGVVVKPFEIDNILPGE
jgi:hypothetical protein